MNYRDMCPRCLLAQADKRAAESVTELIALIPAEERADETLYARRLEKCRGCDWLSGGLCGKCGCYVELRAARTAGYCPHELKYW